MDPSIFEGREVAERIMRPLFIVLVDPFFCDGSHLRQGFKDIHVEHLIAIGAIKSFDVGILRRLARLDKFQIDGMLFRPVGQGGGDKFRTIVNAGGVLNWLKGFVLSGRYL